MKILLIRPPIRDFYRTKFREYPLGLLYLAASLEKEGHQVQIIDSTCSKKVKKITTPSELSYLEKYYTPQNNLFLDFKHFGISYQEISRRALSFSPDIVGITAQFTPYIQEVLDTAKAIKSILPQVPIIAGGVHATVDPQSLLESGNIDYIIKGEGELSLPSVISQISNREKVSQIIEGKVVDIEQLPLPARHLIDPKKYCYGKRPYTMLFTSRGCPCRCSFCSTHSVMGHKYRVRTNQSIIEEIEKCVEMGIEVFDFQDDNLLIKKDKFKSLLSEIIQKFSKGKFEWMATNGLNVSLLDREMLLLMQEAGFKKLDLALATGPVSSRSGLKRPETIEQYEEIISITNEIGLATTTYIILGLPNQPLEEMKETVEYLMDKNTLISPSVFYNVPGMPMFEASQKYEYLTQHLARRSSCFNNFGEDFSRDDIFELFKQIRINNLEK